MNQLAVAVEDVKVTLCQTHLHDSQNLFALYFIWKDENPLPCRRSSKYNAGQEIRTGTP